MYTTVIIEDDPMITRLNRRYIEQDSRFAVVQTFSAAHPALFWLRRNPIDLIILDVYMPQMSGTELLMQLRAKGVDADVADAVTEETLDQAVQFVKQFAAKSGFIVAITGAIDLVSDGEKCYVIRNGRPEMGKITGTGCQLSGMMTAFLVANPDNHLEAAAAAVCTMGLAGEIGWGRMQEGDGNSTYRNRIIDAVYNMDASTLDKGAKYEVR